MVGRSVGRSVGRLVGRLVSRSGGGTRILILFIGQDDREIGRSGDREINLSGDRPVGRSVSRLDIMIVFC